MATVFSLHDLIAAPVVALLDADANAARRSAEFLADYGFGSDGELRTFTFHYARNGEIVSVTLPAIALIPLPALQIKDAQFRFGVHILDGTRPATARAQIQPPPLQLRGMFARGATSSDQTSTDATIAVTVNVTQSDVPSGVSALLAALHDASNIEVKQ